MATETVWLSIATLAEPEKVIDAIDKLVVASVSIADICCLATIEGFARLLALVDTRTAASRVSPSELAACFQPIQPLIHISGDCTIYSTSGRFLHALKRGQTATGHAAPPNQHAMRMRALISGCWLNPAQREDFARRISSGQVAMAVNARGPGAWPIVTRTLLGVALSPVCGIINAIEV